MGRFRGLDFEDRLCFICASGVEDEKHFLLGCAEYEASRAQLWLDLKRLVSQGHEARVLSDLEREIGAQSYPAIIDLENSASMKLAERLGFVRQGDGVYRDEPIAFFRRPGRL